MVVVNRATADRRERESVCVCVCVNDARGGTWARREFVKGVKLEAAGTRRE